MAARRHLRVDQGATFREVFDWQDANGAAVDLTGWTARMQIRRSPGDTVLATPDISLGGVAGTVTVHLTDAQTAALPTGRSVYDLDLVAPGGDVTRFLRGNVYVSGRVTRP